MLKLCKQTTSRFSDTAGTIKISCLMLLMVLFFIYAGCSHTWSPSDQNALKLVKEYYLYFHAGEKVDAEILKREEFVKTCVCYPIQFQITGSTAKSGVKTFYFIKNKSGEIEIKRYTYGAKGDE